MVGQDKIINQLFSQTIDSLPKTMLFLGTYGCGKHTLCKELGEHFQLPVVDITDNIDFNFLNELYKAVIPSIYVINMIDMPEKKQNTILKFIEEPLDGSFIILLCESKNQLLETICNRCYSVVFEPYSKEVLRTFISDPSQEELLDVCSTPGQIINTSYQQLKDLKALVDKFVSSVNKATLPNTLTLINKFNYKDEFDKYDVKLFFKLVMDKALEAIKDQSDLMYNMYMTTLDFSKRLIDTRINKEPLMENYLVTIWQLMRR